MGSGESYGFYKIKTIMPDGADSADYGTGRQVNLLGDLLVTAHTVMPPTQKSYTGEYLPEINVRDEQGHWHSCSIKAVDSCKDLAVISPQDKFNAGKRTVDLAKTTTLNFNDLVQNYGFKEQDSQVSIDSGRVLGKRIETIVDVKSNNLTPDRLSNLERDILSAVPRSENLVIAPNERNLSLFTNNSIRSPQLDSLLVRKREVIEAVFFPRDGQNGFPISAGQSGGALLKDSQVQGVLTGYAKFPDSTIHAFYATLDDAQQLLNQSKDPRMEFAVRPVTKQVYGFPMIDPPTNELVPTKETALYLQSLSKQIPNARLRESE